MNKTLLNIIKKTLDKSKGKWPDTLSFVWWAYKIAPYNAVGESPFSLAFIMKAMVPPKLNVLSPWVNVLSTKQNLQLGKEQLDYL